MRISGRTMALAVSALLGSAFLGTAWADANKPTIGVVVKIGGIPWFNAMENGIKKAAGETGADAWMIGPTQADAAQQVKAVEDLIARHVDVIAVVPNDAKALEPVFKRAQEAGIKVITHESPDQNYNDWDMELTTAQNYGEEHMKAIAKEMGEKGKYIVYVGSLTVPLHNKWADFAIAYQKAHYPNMQLAADRFGVAESVDDSYKTALDEMRAIPDLKGILTFGSQGPIGAARALDEKGKAKDIALVGSFSPGQGAKFVKEGTIRLGYMWNPELAGEVIVRMGAMLAKGQQPTDGMNMPGVGAMAVDGKARSVMAAKLEKIDKDTVDGLAAMGL
jgi:simple sugar transport system substrate-binding protein